MDLDFLVDGLRDDKARPSTPSAILNAKPTVENFELAVVALEVAQEP